MARPTLLQGIRIVDRLGAALVYPLDNRPDPRSLWSEFFPRSPMRWEWDSEGDDRVARLWGLREEMSRSGEVVYLKWFRGRATFFSKPVYAALLAALGGTRERPFRERASRDLLEALRDRSPLSTKELKKAVDLRGRDNEAVYTRALKELWERAWIVGWGEKDDGAFPSLEIGAAEHLFEGLWREAAERDAMESRARLRELWPLGSAFRRFFEAQVRAADRS